MTASIPDVAPDDIHERWIAFVTAHDRSGTLAALVGVFASRGVSFEAFSTLRVADGVGTMSISFRGSARLAGVLRRTLERLAVTREVELYPASHAGLRAVAVIRDAAPPLAAGTLAEVEEACRLAVEAGGRVEAVTVLPPLGFASGPPIA